MQKVKIHFPNLDGLRFCAFFSVFIAHSLHLMGYIHPNPIVNRSLYYILSNGDLGVNFFFVLSGFLITYLLFKEQEFIGKVDIKRFYLRRILRIWPVYFVVVAIGFMLVPNLAFVTAIKSTIPFSIDIPMSTLPWYICFGANFDLVFTGVKSLVVVILWSVSVEEQFYLVWPVLIQLFKNHITKIIGTIILLSFVYRFVNYNNYAALSYSTWSVVSDLAIGSLAAYFTFFRPAFVSFFGKIRKNHILLAYVAGVGFILLRKYFHYFNDKFVHVFMPFEALVLSVFFAFIILEQNFAENSFYKIGNLKFISRLGKISYGLYCYHSLAIVITLLVFQYAGLRHGPPSTLVYLSEVVTALFVSIAISACSYRFMEQRFIALKGKFSYLATGDK